MDIYRNMRKKKTPMKMQLPLLLICMMLMSCAPVAANESITEVQSTSGEVTVTTQVVVETQSVPEEIQTEQTLPEETQTEQTLPEETQTEQTLPAMDYLEELVDSMTIEEQVGQMFFVRCPSTKEEQQAAVESGVGGFILFARDFVNRTPNEVRENICAYQEAAKFPLLIGVDEEGGTVVRASNYPQHRKTKFPSPQELYAAGGFEAVQKDVLEKSEFLRYYGIHLNLAPVADVTENPEDFIYERTFGKNAMETAEYISVVVKAYKEAGFGCTLKHFPGYGSNVDTHTGIAVDNRTMEEFRRADLLPFQAGIDAGAPCVMISHNIICCMDEAYPASLSAAVHNLLREELGFDGVIMTDDLAMDAISKYTYGENAYVLAVLAGNDLLIDSNYEEGIEAVVQAVNEGKISKDRIRESVLRVLKLKEKLGLLS